ncbi:MAG TPA: ABC transporter permease subunit [Gemmatimonadaceae bacterium]|jgi:ABC-2 type transport system permease protein|nr:ABC transporter permease subunit [Gemmatimonadaceae bacterium]
MTEQTAAAIYDLGYQRYTGVRRGRLYAIRALLAFTYRSAFGIGRGQKAKTMPSVLTGVVYLWAAGQIMFASSAGLTEFINYANFFEFTTLIVALFAAAQAPECIVTDKQQGVISLYLSRPLYASDYALAKIGGLTAAMLVITLGPQLLLFAGKMAISASPWSAFEGEWTKLFPIVGGTVLASVFIASVALLLSSFTSRRGYGTAAVIVFFLLAPVVVNMFRAVTTGGVRRYSLLLHPMYLMVGFANWLFDIEAKRRTVVGRADLPGSTYLMALVMYSVLCVVLLMRRVRRLDA